MKYLKICTLLLCITVFAAGNLYAQNAKNNNPENKKFERTVVNELPQKVKDAVLLYQGYIVKETFIGAEKSNAKTYKVVLTNGWRNITVLVNKRGKLIKTLE